MSHALPRHAPLRRFRSPWRSVLLGGLVAGTLDLVYICSFWAFRGVGPERVLQGVAAGWLGRDAAVAGGTGSTMLGLFSHYGIAACMAAAYFLVARSHAWLSRSPFVSGAAYGVVLYLAMTCVVVPLSAAGSGGIRAPGWSDLSHLAAHMFLVGVPCAWFARLALRDNPARPTTRD